VKALISQLFIACLSGLVGGLILVSLVIYLFFESQVTGHKVLEFYGMAMLAGFLLGGLCKFILIYKKTNTNG